MRRLAILGVLVLSVLAPAVGVKTVATAATVPTARAPQLLAFRGFHLGGGGLGGRHFGFGGFGRRGSSHVFRRVAHALVFAYILHLFFAHGGLSILLWLLVIGLVVHLLRRGRGRRARYT